MLDFSLVAEAAAPAGLDVEGLERLASSVLTAEGAEGPWAITVALVDDARLRGLHRDFMGSDTPTDIMTFPLNEDGMTASGGDLVISVDHALNQAESWGHTPAEEIEFLVVHGLLHLRGWRDESDDARQRMLDRQRELIDRWKQE